jgi:hypothetical protein
MATITTTTTSSSNMINAVYATPAFMSTLTALFPADSKIPNPAAWIAGIVFAAHNLPKETAAAYSYAVNAGNCPAEASNITRVFREAVFKAGTMYGTPRMINALLAVKAEMKELGVADEGAYRDPNKTIEKLNQEGVDMFYHTYGESADTTRELLKGVHPDFGIPPRGSPTERKDE